MTELQLGFTADQVEDVVVGDNGGVTLLLNEEGKEHLGKVQDMMEMH